MFDTLTDMPLIAHVHVPKTAGSTINAFLAKAAGDGRDHLQGLVGDDASFLEAIRETSWVAGHIPAPVFREALSKAGKTASFVTALREPVDHVASHYNWLIEIGHRGEPFLRGHPGPIQAIHNRILNSDNSNPAVIIQNLEAHAGLFLNCQAKHVVGPGYASPETSYAKALDMFEAVVFANDVAGAMSRLFPDCEVETERRNTSRYHFDKSVFDAPEVRAFLMDRNRADETLWAVANAKYRADEKQLGT